MNERRADLARLQARRRELGQHGQVDRRTPTTQFRQGAVEIATVEQDYRCGDEIERGGAGLLKCHRPRQTVACLSRR
jgi:hypothetical protein